MSEPITLPRGFRAAGLHCGIKSDPQKLDLACFLSDEPASSAGVFTQNRVVGAPVTVSRKRVKRPTTRAVLINSGNANACTGEQGVTDAQWMTSLLAEALDVHAEDVLVCSTGVIGHPLPRSPLESGIPTLAGKLADDADSLQQAAAAMMTTDTVAKLAMRQIDSLDAPVTVTGVAKGAAMIAPNMATMLAVIMTDASLPTSVADELLREAVDRSFNAISVDGHTSTSDSVLLLANGSSEANVGTEEGLAVMQEAITAVCIDLAQMIIRDAEGAEHFVIVDVNGLATSDDARRIAKAVCESPLVKTAITGNDPNWGRIVSAAGYAGVEFKEADCSLAINSKTIYRAGVPAEYDDAAVSQLMATGEVHIQLSFTLGDTSARFWTSDLTAEYIRLNSDYTT